MRFARIWPALLMAASAGPLCLAQEPAAQQPVAKNAPVARSPLVDARCETHLRKMAEHLKSLKSFSFEAEVLYDEAGDGGQKLLFGRRISGDLVRPDRAKGTAHDDQYTKSYWYDGKAVTVLDVDAKTYSRVDAPDTIDAMFDTMATRYALVLPFGDLLVSDPLPMLVTNVESGRYVGMHKIAGVDCHHLAFTQPNVDWQIWIDGGEHPFPRRLAITYKNANGSPQYIATFVKWDAAAKFADDHFKFVAPSDAQAVEMQPLEEPAGAATDEKTNKEEQ